MIEELNMIRTRHLPLVLLGAMTIAPAAFAEEADGMSAGRFAVVGSYNVIQPDSDPIPGSRVDLDGGNAPTLSFSWYANNHFAVELWGAVDKIDHDLRGDEGKFGTVSQRPLALSAQYHFGKAGSPIRPFVGLGYFQSKITHASSTNDIIDGELSEFSTQKGGIATIGTDFNVNKTWFARVDARYMKGSSELRNFVEHGETNPNDKFEVNLDPWTVGVGIGARF
ncbi:OmpW/AlkL family protein [Luteimonas sp. R10]|uniref:OmpW/AlkL family protein n=1 Tax=Luteimonas sp. R10 TaxID=3108176 RepID=UPI003086AE89|nr:OmpW family outer membrane protein [Luteimonas sp. R10]